MEDQQGVWNKARMAVNNNTTNTNTTNKSFTKSTKNKQQKQNHQKWVVVSFAVEQVSRKDLFISLQTRRGFFTNTICMKLVSLTSKRCSLTQTQLIRGPAWRFGKSYKKLQMNLYAANQTFKNHVESQHFQNLLGGMSTRKLSLGAKSSLAFDGGDGGDEDEGGKMHRSTDFWQTPPELRSELISMFVGGSYKNK
jgi:hypothetical protein